MGIEGEGKREKRKKIGYKGTEDKGKGKTRGYRRAIRGKVWSKRKRTTTVRGNRS